MYACIYLFNDDQSKTSSKAGWMIKRPKIPLLQFVLLLVCLTFWFCWHATFLFVPPASPQTVNNLQQQSWSKNLNHFLWFNATVDIFCRYTEVKIFVFPGGGMSGTNDRNVTLLLSLEGWNRLCNKIGSSSRHRLLQRKITCFRQQRRVCGKSSASPYK